MRTRSFAVLVVLAACFVMLTGMGTAPGGGGAGPNSEVEQAVRSGMPVFIDAGSDHCVPCKQMLPVLETLKKKYAGRVRIVVVDVEEHKNYAKKLGVVVIPTQIMLDRTGKETGRHVGFMSETEADAFIGKALK